MKKITLALTLLCLAASTNNFAQTADNQYVIFKGTADAAYNGQQLVIYNHAINLHDSVTVVGGKFELSVPFNGPGRYMFYSKYELKKRGGYTPYGILVAKPGAIDFNVAMDTLAKSTVKNDPENSLYIEFIKEGAPARELIQDKLNEKFGADVIAKLTQKDAQYAEVDKYYNELNETINLGQIERLGSFIKLHPDAFASMYILNTMITIIPADKAQLYYDELTPVYKNTSYAASIQKTIDAKIITT
jgi:hypothetical protein